MDPPRLFANVSNDCHPIATKSRKYSRDDSVISSEVKRLLAEGIIEPSLSPWRAQVVVVNRTATPNNSIIPPDAVYFSCDPWVWCLLEKCVSISDWRVKQS